MVYKPTSNISYAKATLPCPLFAADFDPYNRGYLVVAGGGGEGRTGVPNVISVLDISNRATIETAAEIRLPTTEDSVQSLANLATKDGLVTLAGINSSLSEQRVGKNEHFRSFDITYPPRKKQKVDQADESEEAKGDVKPIGKKSIFKAKQDTYQRLLRLSPAQKRAEGGSRRVGAIATGDMNIGQPKNKPEILVFNATNATPDDSDILARLTLDAEANDLDITEPEKGEFSLTYCTDYDIYEQTYRYDFATKKVEKLPKGPRRIHQMPFPDAVQDPRSRPKFRCVRFLNAQNIVAICNKPKETGVELRIIHLYPTGPAMLSLQKALPSRIKSSAAMDVCALDADKYGNQQCVVAVAGKDSSIEVYTTDYQGVSDTFTGFKSYITLRDVHPQQMTKVVFSPFHSPARAPDPDTDEKGSTQQGDLVKQHPGPQYIRLASISYGNTLVLDTFPLAPLDPKDKRSRYVLSHPSDARFLTGAYIAVITMIVLVTAFLLQSFLVGFSDSEGKGVGVFSLLPSGVRDFLDAPAAMAQNRAGWEKVTVDMASAVESNIPSAVPGKAKLVDLLAHRASDPDAERKALVVRDSGDSTELSVDVHEDKEEYLKQDSEAKHWHELSAEQKARWRERLIRTGHVTEQMLEDVGGEGKKVLLGVLFSEYAGLVGGVAREAMREL